MFLCVSKRDKASFLCHSLKLNSDIVITTKILVIVSYTHQISSPYSNFLGYLIIFKIHLFGRFGSVYKHGPYLACGKRAFMSVLACWQSLPFSLCPLVTCGQSSQVVLLVGLRFWACWRAPGCHAAGSHRASSRLCASARTPGRCARYSP